MQYLLLFLEGIITFISPCLLPMLPVYLSFFAAGESGKKKTVVNALGFVLGFTLVFVILGAFAGTVGHLLQQYATAVNLVTGFLVIILGLNYLGVLNIGFLNRSSEHQANIRNLNVISAVLFGMAFSVGWTPCVGAFLGAALMMASQQGGIWTGIMMLLVYSLGVGLPFVLSAILLDELKGTFTFIKRHYKVIHKGSGCLLVIVGFLMATGWLGRMLPALTF